jgi:translation initiation factor 6 (eIF-6)|tara:strand:- start:1761 stop:1937 length:177 start_codon:yes stop_codon:yes gene_type:complete
MIRDSKSNALINNDVAALNKYKLERNRVQKIESLLKEVREIRKVITSVCERLDRIESN